MKRIPIKAARDIAEAYGYDQVIVIARAVGEGQHVTTYGKNATHCRIAAACGHFLRFKVMGWAMPEAPRPPRPMLLADLGLVMDTIDRPYTQFEQVRIAP